MDHHVTTKADVVRDVTLVLEQLYAEDPLRFASPTRRRRYLGNDPSYDPAIWHKDTLFHYAITPSLGAPVMSSSE